MKIKISNFRRLPGEERQILVQALVMLPVVALTLRLGGLGKTQRLLTRFSPEPVSSSSLSSYLCKSDKAELPPPQAIRITRLVTTAGRYQRLWASCLNQSLLLWWLLRLHHIASDLQIGVRREAGKFEAHAWIECRGQVLNDREDVRQRFSAFELPIQGWREVR